MHTIGVNGRLMYELSRWEIDGAGRLLPLGFMMDVCAAQTAAVCPDAYCRKEEGAKDNGHISPTASWPGTGSRSER